VQINVSKRTESRSVFFFGFNSIYLISKGPPPVLHCTSLLCLISCMVSERIKKMAAFSPRVDLAIHINRDFLEKRVW